MNKRVKIKDKNIDYTLRRRRGARSVRLAIYSDGAFVVTAPKWYPLYIINRFLAEKAEWIYDKLKSVDFTKLAAQKQEEEVRYKAGKKIARDMIEERIKLFNWHYNFSYNSVSIKNQKSCWGSCSAKKNLNFNYMVAFLPEKLRDYVIVHELCHLQELNHGRKFWELVGETVPDYAELRKKLKTKTKL